MASGSHACFSVISRKIHGLISAPRPIITDATPLCCQRSCVSNHVSRSPLPITGIARSDATLAISSQSAARE